MRLGLVNKTNNFTVADVAAKEDHLHLLTYLWFRVVEHNDLKCSRKAFNGSDVFGLFGSLYPDGTLITHSENTWRDCDVSVNDQTITAVVVLWPKNSDVSGWWATMTVPGASDCVIKVFKQVILFENLKLNCWFRSLTRILFEKSFVSKRFNLTY